MSKRRSIIGDLSLKIEEPTAATDAPKVINIRPAKPAPMADLVRSSIYLSREAHDRLREIAFAERKKVHDLIVEGVDTVIAKRGHKETARRRPKAL